MVAKKVEENFNLTPLKVETKLLQLVRQTIAATEYFDSVEFRSKTCAKRTRTTSVLIESEAMEVDEVEAQETNSKKWTSVDKLLNSMDWDNWSEETKWKRYDSDTASVEFNVTEPVNESSKTMGGTSKLKVPNGKEDKLKLMEVKDVVSQVSDGKEDELKTHNGGVDVIENVGHNDQAPLLVMGEFGEEDVDPIEFEKRKKKTNSIRFLGGNI